MSTAAAPLPKGAAPRRPQRHHDLRRSLDRFGDGLLAGVCALAGLVAIVVLGLIGYEVLHGATPAISRYGVGFTLDTIWKPNPPFEEFGAGVVLYGTLVSSFFALLL